MTVATEETGVIEATVGTEVMEREEELVEPGEEEELEVVELSNLEQLYTW